MNLQTKKRSSESMGLGSNFQDQNSPVVGGSIKKLVSGPKMTKRQKLEAQARAQIEAVMPEGTHFDSYECDSCHKVFASRQGLQNHIMTVHLNKRAYECEICKKKFSANGSLKRHVDTVHNGKREFGCHICLKTFALKHHLKNHVLTVHNQQNVTMEDLEKNRLSGNTMKTLPNQAGGVAKQAGGKRQTKKTKKGKKRDDLAAASATKVGANPFLGGAHQGSDGLLNNIFPLAPQAPRDANDASRRRSTTFSDLFGPSLRRLSHTLGLNGAPFLGNITEDMENFSSELQGRQSRKSSVMSIPGMENGMIGNLLAGALDGSNHHMGVKGGPMTGPFSRPTQNNLLGELAMNAPWQSVNQGRSGTTTDTVPAVVPFPGGESRQFEQDKHSQAPAAKVPQGAAGANYNFAAVP